MDSIRVSEAPDPSSILGIATNILAHNVTYCKSLENSKINILKKNGSSTTKHRKFIVLFLVCIDKSIPRNAYYIKTSNTSK